MGYHHGLQGIAERFARGKGIRGTDASGFTLAEVLSALMLIGVASAISVSLFSSSHTLAVSNRNHIVAAQLAQEQLSRLTAAPDHFVWPELDALEPGSFGEVELKHVTGQGFQMPSAIPALPRPTEATRRLYESYTWDAYVRLPETGASYAELVVVVRWRDRERPRHYTLTSAMPRYYIEGTP